MSELLTAAEMRGVERAAMESGRAAGRALMERAGQGVVDSVLAAWPELLGGARRAAVLCGPGNNGGDGFVVARLLHARGWDVRVFLYGDPGRLPPDARANFDALPVPCRRWPGDRKAHDPAACDLVVDALFGTGLARPLDPGAGFGAALPERDLRGRPGRQRVVAVDVPSGLCSDSGRTIGTDALWADLTVTFHRAKLGHMLAGGPASCGALEIVDIGLEDGAPASAVRLAKPGPAADKASPSGGATHKYSHGHALVLSGGAGRTGAARLAARGALRAGAGLVTLGVPGAAQFECAAHVTEIMLTRVEDADGLAAVLGDARIAAVCLGPGLGVDRAPGLVRAALGAGRATVLDADALTAFADAPDALFERLHADCVLTPHGGEFARLFPDLAARLDDEAARGPAFSKIDAARQAADRAGCVVLLKGADTVIAAPDGRAAVNVAAYGRAAPWLATAGAGDVLAGIVTGLMARGFAAFGAAETAAWLHVEAALGYGPGLVAGDLPEALPGVFRALAADEG